MGPYRYSVYDSIGRVDAQEWDRLHDFCSDPFMAPAYIRAVENSMRRDCRFFHVIVRDAEAEPVAAACFCLYTLDATLLAGPVFRALSRPLAWLTPSLLRLKVLFCGLPVSVGASQLRLAPQAEPAPVLQILNDVAERIAAEQRARCIVFKEFDAQECQMLDGLAAFGYRRGASLPMNVIPARWTSFEDYLADLKSRKRSTIRRSRAKFQRRGLRLQQLTGREGAAQFYTDDAHQLYDAVLSHAKVKLERLPAEFFRELARQLPDNTSFTFLYENERIAAFAASVFTRCRYHQLFVGFDYELNPECDLYFNLFYHEMDAAYRRGVKEIFAGQTSDVFKRQKLGCSPRPLFLYIKGCDLRSRAFLRIAFRFLFPENPQELP